MTPAERMKAEKERIERECGFYITPYRMAHLMDAAGKIVNIMVKADTNICYAECHIILDLVSAGIGCAWKRGRLNRDDDQG